MGLILMTNIASDLNIEENVVSALKEVLAQKQESKKFKNSENLAFSKDLGFNSLDLAQFSALLEDIFGIDPYSEGEIPQTLKEVIDFYIKVRET